MKMDKTVDMTRGNILRHILLFSIPMIIGNIFQQLYSMVDTIIVGRTIGMNALAAVGASGSLAFFVIGSAMGLSGGFAIMVSQRFGAGDMQGVRRSIAMGAMLCAVFSALLMAVSIPGTRSLLVLMNTPPEVIDDAQAYITVIFWGIPITVLYNYLSSVLRALGDSRTPLYFLLIASVLNVILDYVCILNFRMGVMGAGVATVFSQGVSAVLCLIYVKKGLPDLFPGRVDWKWNGRFAWYHLRLGVPMAVQTSVIATGAMAVQSSLNQFGAVAMAGYAASGTVEALVIQIMISVGMTLATFVGQNYGARSYWRIREGVRKSTFIIMLIAVLGGVLVTVFGRALTMIFIGASEENVGEVVRYAKHYLTISACFYPVLSCVLIFRNVQQGLGNTGIVLVSSIVELISRLVGAFILAAFFGYTGVCFAGPVTWCGVAVLFIIAYAVEVPRLKRRFETERT